MKLRVSQALPHPQLPIHLLCLVQIIRKDSLMALLSLTTYFLGLIYSEFFLTRSNTVLDSMSWSRILPFVCVASYDLTVTQLTDPLLLIIV